MESYPQLLQAPSQRWVHLNLNLIHQFNYSKKVEKHAKACEDNQHAFVPLAFDTFGSLAPEAVRFLSRVQRVVHSNFSTPQGRGFVFSRSGFSIQKGMAAQFVAHQANTAEFPRDFLGISLPEQPNKYYFVLRGHRLVVEADSTIQTIMEKLQFYITRVALNFEVSS
ncbi:putative mediator complex, subunit Med20 [Helianthus anomalus]